MSPKKYRLRSPSKRAASVAKKKPKKKEAPRVYSIEDFEVLKELGKGSFGVVNLVRDTQSQELYALKCLKKLCIRGKKQIEHVQNEKKILKQFSPGDFCSHMLGSFQDEEHLYILLEYLPGGELIRRIRGRTIMTEEDIRFYMAEIVLGVERLHSHGIIYRDLKPENILIDS